VNTTQVEREPQPDWNELRADHHLFCACGLVTDAEIVAYVRATYGDVMALRVAEMLAEDPDGTSAFVRSVRASLIREMGERDGETES